jgi:hypothetical protein
MLLSIALLSVALIAYQIAMIQLLSLSQWYHYANMVISIALLGFGGAGTILTVFRERLLRHSDKLLPLLMILSGLTMVLAVDLSQYDFARFDSYLLFVERKQWWVLCVSYVLFFLPFFFGALAIGMIFAKYVSEIGRLYFADLAGAGIGAIAAAALAWYFRPAALPAVISLLAISAGLILLSKENRGLVLFSFLVSSAVCIYRIINPVELSISQYKSLSRTMNLPAAEIDIHSTTPYGFVEVVSAEALRYGPGLSLAFTGEIPVTKAVFNNGDWVGPVVSWSSEDSVHLLDFTTSSLAYVLDDINNVLVLHAGTGMNVSHAISRGAKHVDAVEPHRGIVDLLRNELARDNDSLFHNSAVMTHITEPRTFMLSTDNQYDLIELPMVGSFGGSAGLYAMREEYILTKQSFLQLWNLLNKNGAISITAWMDYPFRNPLKLVATFGEVMEELNLPNPDQHLTAVRSWGTVTFLLKKSPLSSTEVHSIRSFCDMWSFDPVFLPGLKAEERTQYNAMHDMSFFSYADQLLNGDRKELYNAYDFHLKPATDNKPYFSQFLRWRSIPHLTDMYGSNAVPFLEMGLLISTITFLQISLLAVLLIILPLFRIGWKGGNKLWVLVYFSSIGVGYMLLEILFIQKFILFFGNPVYSASLVIGVMLLSSGAGSYFSSGIQLKRSAILRILLAIVVILVIYSIFLSSFLQWVTGSHVVIKLLTSLILIALPAFFMGFPFPTGLTLCSQTEERNVPWAWGINGCASVISASLASLLAVELGFAVVIVLATLAYVTCLLSLFLLQKP